MSRIDSKKQRRIDYSVYLVFRVIVCVIQAMPIRGCQQMARFMARLIVKHQKRRGKVIDDNLYHAYPDWDLVKRAETSLKMWEGLIMMVCEIAHAPRKIHETNWRSFVNVKEVRALVGALTDNRPVVVVTGHYGNFEIGGYIAGLLGFPNYTVQRPLDNPYIAQYLNQFRVRNGQYVLPKVGSAATIEKVLARKEAIVLLGDQHAGNSGCWVDFMGRPASCHKALALFTLTGAAPMVVTYTRREQEPMRFTIGVEGVADPDALTAEQEGVAKMTKWYSDCIERMVRKEPSQYWWLHRRWREKPVRKKKRRLSAAA